MEDPVTLTHCQTVCDNLQKAVKKYGLEKSQKTPSIWIIKEHAERTKQSLTPLIKPKISLEREIPLTNSKRANINGHVNTREENPGVFSYAGMLKCSMSRVNPHAARGCFSAQNTV